MDVKPGLFLQRGQDEFDFFVRARDDMDGNDFADALGLSFDGAKFGMGKRSQRYSMIVNDGVVEQLNIEQPGEYKVSSAEHLLTQL